MANPIFLNLGVKVDDIFKNLDNELVDKIEQASAEGFTRNELRTLEEDGIDVSLIEDNCTNNETTEIKDADSEEVREAKQKLQDINKNILDKSTQIRTLEGDILLLEDEINENFEENINKNKELEQEQKEAINKTQKEEMAKYTASQGEMTEDEFKENLADKLNGLDSEFGAKFAKIANDILENEIAKTNLAGLIAKQETLNTEIKTLKTEADTISAQIDILEARQNIGDEQDFQYKQDPPIVEENPNIYDEGSVKEHLASKGVSKNSLDREYNEYRMQNGTSSHSESAGYKSPKYSPREQNERRMQGG